MAVSVGPSMSAQSLDFGRLTEEYANVTVREMISSTSGVSLAQLVAQRAAIQLLTLVDARRFCRVELVPPGGGTTFHFQQVVAVAPASSGEPSSDISLADPTISDITATLVMFRTGTFVGDMAQRQAAVNLAEVVGIAHGNGMNQQMNKDIYTVSTQASNILTRSVGTGSDGKTTNYAFSDLINLRGQIERQRGRPDSFVTIPESPAVSTGVEIGWYPLVQSNISSVQFTAALADYLRSGSIAELFGLRLYVDKVFDLGTSNYGSNANDVIGMATVSNEAVGWAQAEDIVSEVQRWALQVGFRIVTHSIGKTAAIIPSFIGVIQHP